MWTVLVPISCNATLLRSRIDRVLGVVEDLLHDADGVQIHRDFDNIWYIRYGLAGPALAVTDRWLIISYSPTALRQNLSRLTDTRPVASHPP